MLFRKATLITMALVSLGLAACASGFKATYDADPAHDFSGSLINLEAVGASTDDLRRVQRLLAELPPVVERLRSLSPTYSSPSA